MGAGPPAAVAVVRGLWMQDMDGPSEGREMMSLRKEVAVLRGAS